MPRSCNKQNSVNKRKVCGIKAIKIINYANIRGIKETNFWKQVYIAIYVVFIENILLYILDPSIRFI